MTGLPTGMKCNIDLFEPHKCNYFSVGSMTYKCEYCEALGFKDENRSGVVSKRHYGILCCNQKTVVLDSIPTPPADMLSAHSGLIRVKRHNFSEPTSELLMHS